MVRTNFKNLIKIHGQKVIDNPFKYLRLPKSKYRKDYLQTLKTRLIKRHSHLLKK